MKLLSSRRLTGPNLLLPGEGAVLDVALETTAADLALAAWQDRLRDLLDAVGWGAESPAIRRFSGGLSLAFSAPPDALYAATEVNEEAWRAAEAAAAGEPLPSLGEAVERLRAAIEQERQPALLALRAAAAARSVAFLADGDQVSVGLGVGSLSWPAGEIPSPEEVPWERVHDVPVVLVTGTNGKTTTVRLLAAMARAAGAVAGLTSTDRIEVDGAVIDRGDFSGPGGARTLLRHPKVEMAILETARGGILRRGLAVRHADAAVVTNVAADHLGEFGVGDLEGLADVKMVVARAVHPGGRLVLNGDDPLLVARSGACAGTVVWFSLDPERPAFQSLLRRPKTTAWVLHGAEIERWHGGWKQTLGHVEDIPVTFGGSARHNVANVLAALALGSGLHLPIPAMFSALRTLHGTLVDNPGRGNLLELGGTKILIDYAHNPHGLTAILALAVNLQARRRLLLFGQAGDRDDTAIRDLARTAWSFRPDRIVIKEMPEMLRGRREGEIPALLADELARLGAPADAVTRAPDELEAVREALTWARPGDLLLFLVHTRRDAVFQLLERLRDARWQAGQPVAR